MYFFAEIELHSDPEYLKKIFSRFPLKMYHTNFMPKNNHLPYYVWDWCTVGDVFCNKMDC